MTVKMINAWTLELDEPEVAVSEILDQLNLEENTLENAAGFITCSYDYIETGIAEAVCDAVPFDVVGGTTLTNANNDEAGTMLFCLSMLTADDCQFASGVTEPFEENLDEIIGAAVQGTASTMDQGIKMALAFLPMYTMHGIGGEVMLGALDKALDGTPIFGTVACDSDTACYSNTFTIYNGEFFKDRMPFLLISGNVEPHFIVTSTSEQNIRKQQAIITSSEGCLLKQVNNMTARDYFNSIGLSSGKGLEAMSSVPFVVDYNDGTQPVARAIYGINEDGSAVCGGVMPEGSTLYIGRMDVDDILLTAETSLKGVIKSSTPNGIILLPCLGRNMVLVMDPMAEIEVVRRIIGDTVPWHLAYSGGECCPVYTKDGGTVNRYHNFTFIGCAI